MMKNQQFRRLLYTSWGCKHTFSGVISSISISPWTPVEVGAASFFLSDFIDFSLTMIEQLESWCCSKVKNMCDVTHITKKSARACHWVRSRPCITKGSSSLEAGYTIKSVSRNHPHNNAALYVFLFLCHCNVTDSDTNTGSPTLERLSETSPGYHGNGVCDVCSLWSFVPPYVHP